MTIEARIERIERFIFELEMELIELGKGWAGSLMIEGKLEAYRLELSHEQRLLEVYQGAKPY